MSWFIVSELVLYICFGLLIGSQVLQMVPDSKRPAFVVPEHVLRLSILLIALCSFFPVLRIVLMFAEGTEIGIATLFETVLLDFNVGQAWIITALACGSLIVLRNMKSQLIDSRLDVMERILTILLFVAFAYASHCTTSYEWAGFAAHGVHFLAVSVWIGILLVIGWFALDHQNWLAFLRWFTPLAIGCFVVTLVAGLTLMNWLVPDVVNSWIVSYGQALLIKHLLIVPLLVFALLNSVYVRRKVLSDAAFCPLPWVRAESLSGMTVFAAMAVMGNQSPTENLQAVIKFEKPSTLFDWFYSLEITPTTTLQLAFTWNGMMMGLLALFCLFTLVFIAVKRRAPLPGLGFGLIFVISAYLAMMFSVQ